MTAKSLDTSITDNTARNFLKETGRSNTLFCKKITGFHLLKTKTRGSWRYRYQNEDGKRRVVVVGNYPTMKPQEAAQKVIEWRNKKIDVLGERERAQFKRREDAVIAENRTIRAFLDGAYKRYQERRRSGNETLGTIRHNFESLLDRDMASLTKADVRAWQDKREIEGRALSTLRRAYGALRTMILYALKEKVIDVDPLADIGLEKPLDKSREKKLEDKRRAARRLLTPDEIQALHAGLDAFADKLRVQRRNSRAHGKPSLLDLDVVTYPHWFIPFAYCALYTGLRTGDLFSLTWLELNVTFGRLVKTPEKTSDNETPAQVVMDMAPDLLNIVRAWHKQQGKPSNGLVFPSPVTGERMDKKAHGKAWAHVKRLGGLPDDLAFYAMRHHFISTLVSSNVPLMDVARLAGHKKVSMIEEHYHHLCPTAARDVLAIFAASVSRNKSGDAAKTGETEL